MIKISEVEKQVSEKYKGKPLNDTLVRCMLEDFTNIIRASTGITVYPEIVIGDNGAVIVTDFTIMGVF